MMNQALREHMNQRRDPLEKTLRRVIPAPPSPSHTPPMASRLRPTKLFPASSLKTQHGSGPPHGHRERRFIQLRMR